MSSAFLVQRLATSATLLVWGTAFGGLWFSGRMDAYPAPAFRPYAFAAGCVLAALAALVLSLPAPTAGCNDEVNRGGALRSVLLAVALVAPLLIAFATTQDSFTANTVLNRGYVPDVTRLPGPPPTMAVDPALPDGETSFGDAAMLVPRNEHGEVQAAVIDLLYAAQIPEMRPEFENQRVEVVGQLMPARDHNPTGKSVDIVRMFMSCCAADAQPVALTANPKTPPGLKDMTWVKVRGVATFPLIGGRTTPILEDAIIEQTTPPDETFLY